MKKAAYLFSLLFLCLFIAGCTPPPAGGDVVISPLPPVDATPIPPESLYIDPAIPSALREGPVVTGLVTDAGGAFTLAGSPADADVTLSLDPGAGAVLSARWIYALAGAFATVPDDISWAGFTAYFTAADTAGLPDFGAPPTLLVTEADLNALASLLGLPSPGLPLVITTADSLEADLWAYRPALAFLPFERITPYMKVFSVNGMSPLSRDFNYEAYPLALSPGLSTVTPRGAAALERLSASGIWPATNRDPAKLSVVTLTGVTAMARATAMQIELRGYDFPSQDILPFLADADILHTSNEVSFTSQCPPPDWFGDLVFCSAPRYLEVLTRIGVDVVELTGNHLNDYGTAPLSGTLDLYDAAGITTFGGGRTTEDARQPRILETPSGARVAFIGCNSPGPFTAFSSGETPGAAACEDYAWMKQTITGLKENDAADVVIATVQHFELASYQPSDQQVSDFLALAAAGADVVIGTQAHQPQGFAFSDGAFIHYGLGNLFFDQMDYIENRQMFADRLVLYEDSLIGVTLFTGLIEDYARPRPMTLEERVEFLDMMFEMSGW